MHAVTLSRLTFSGGVLSADTNVVVQAIGSAVVTNNIGYLIGSHLANPEGTNITLQATKADSYIGTSNVNIVAIMGGVSGTAYYKNIVITNGTGVTWGMSFSAVTNNWKWFLGSAAPTVITNGTQCMISTRVDGTNVLAGYAYALWP